MYSGEEMPKTEVPKTKDEQIKEYKSGLIAVTILFVCTLALAIGLGISYSKELAWKEVFYTKMCDHLGESSAGCKGMGMLKNMDAEAIKDLPMGSSYNNPWYKN